MARICIYDVTKEEEDDFTTLPDVHDVVMVSESLGSENVDAQTEILSIFVNSTVDAQLIEAMPKLKLIACRSTGFNNVDMNAANARGITVVNVPTYGEHTVAEYAFALLLALAKKIIPGSSQMAMGENDHSLVHGMDVYAKTLGVIGAGKIGKNVIKIAKAFKMNVIVYDPFLKPDIAEAEEINTVELEELAQQADIITLHVPLTDDNGHMINEELISKMKDGVYLINTARGELVDSPALISALKTGKIAGAGLDVLEDEKLMEINEEELLLKKGAKTRETLEHVVANTILMRMPNVILTSHNAYNTTEAIVRINSITVENIKHYLVGSTPNKVSA